MREEHFGITIVEMMAAGLLMVTHDSAGAQQDIIKHRPEGQRVGYLCQTEEDYFTTLQEIVQQQIDGSEMTRAVSERARRQAEYFSDEAFMGHFL